jgi:hypothetical protein
VSSAWWGSAQTRAWSSSIFSDASSRIDPAARQVGAPAAGREGDPRQGDPAVVLDDGEGGRTVGIVAARLRRPELRDVHQSIP